MAVETTSQVDAQSETPSTTKSIPATESSSETSSSTVGTTDTNAPEHAEGPKPEEEAEADRVREVLFPEVQID